MKSYTSGLAVTVTLNLVDPDTQEPLVVNGLQWRIVDEFDTVLSDWATLAVPQAPETEVTLSILSAINILTPPATKGARTVELSVATDKGTRILSETILLVANSTLHVGANSFQTYAMSQVNGLNVEGRAEAERVLIDAYESITKLPLAISPLASDGKSIAQFRRGSTTMLSSIAFEDYALLVPDAMKAALRHAQVLEANELLSADPVVLARRNGLVSMTVGESSQFFGASKALSTPVLSARAMEILSPWLVRRDVILTR